MLFVVLCPGTPKGSTGSGSGFKASQKTGQRLKVSSHRLGEAGNRTCDPWFTRHRFIPYNSVVSGAQKNHLIEYPQHIIRKIIFNYTLFWSWQLNECWFGVSQVKYP